jgi:predicted ATPase
VPDDSLLERDFELRALRETLTDAENGVGDILVLDAPAGLGKTALIRQVRTEARARGFTVLSARGAQAETDFGFGVLRQLFEPRGASEPGLPEGRGQITYLSSPRVFRR